VLLALAAATLPALAHAQPARTVEVLGVVARYADTEVSPRGPEKLDRLIGATAEFYEEGSGGAYAIRGTTLPRVLAIEQPRPEGRCGLPRLDLLAAALSREGVDLGRYQRMVLFVPESAAGCNGGRAFTATFRRGAEVLRMPLAITFSLTERFVIHEYGHGDGLGHAQSVDCGADVIGARCRIREYGNVWDTMGNGYVQTYQAAFRAHLGWTRPVVHASGTATYQIGPAYRPGELPNAIEVPLPPPKPGTIAVRAPMSLWIEWRAPHGFDARMKADRFAAFRDGAMVNLVGRWSAPAGGRAAVYDCPRLQPCLLDMTPGDGRHDNGGLEAGRSWTDPNTGVSIVVGARGDSSLTVTVSVP
jgi:hypothetical protein